MGFSDLKINDKVVIFTPLESQNPSEIIQFCDRNIGEGYFTAEDIETIRLQSEKDGKNCSFLAYHDNEIIGIRFTYAPGKDWSVLFDENDLLVDRWPGAKKQAAYFKSLYIDQKYQGLGIGQALSNKSIQVIKQLGGRFIISHCWKESPNNSSQRYFSKMNFESIGEHPKFWSKIDYNCTRCQRPPCQCTALEMVRILD